RALARERPCARGALEERAGVGGGGREGARLRGLPRVRAEASRRRQRRRGVAQGRRPRGLGRPGRARGQLRKEYLRRWPNDHASALEILERLAHEELATVSPEHPLAALLATPRPVAGKTGKLVVTPPSYLAQYLKLVAQKPAEASKPLLAEIRF